MLYTACTPRMACTSPAAWDVHWGSLSTIERVTIQAARLVTRPELLHGTGAPA